jgi:hypothetical protein
MYGGRSNIRNLDVEVTNLLGKSVLAALGTRKHPPESLLGRDLRPRLLR